MNSAEAADELLSCLASNGRLCDVASALLHHARRFERKVRLDPDLHALRRAAKRSTRKAQLLVLKAFDARLLILQALGASGDTFEDLSEGTSWAVCGAPDHN